MKNQLPFITSLEDGNCSFPETVIHQSIQQSQEFNNFIKNLTNSTSSSSSALFFIPPMSTTAPMIYLDSDDVLPTSSTSSFNFNSYNNSLFTKPFQLNTEFSSNDLDIKTSPNSLPSRAPSPIPHHHATKRKLSPTFGLSKRQHLPIIGYGSNGIQDKTFQWQSTNRSMSDLHNLIKYRNYDLISKWINESIEFSTKSTTLNGVTIVMRDFVKCNLIDHLIEILLAVHLPPEDILPLIYPLVRDYSTQFRKNENQLWRLFEKQFTHHSLHRTIVPLFVLQEFIKCFMEIKACERVWTTLEDLVRKGCVQSPVPHQIVQHLLTTSEIDNKENEFISLKFIAFLLDPYITSTAAHNPFKMDILIKVWHECLLQNELESATKIGYKFELNTEEFYDAIDYLSDKLCALIELGDIHYLVNFFLIGSVFLPTLVDVIVDQMIKKKNVVSFYQEFFKQTVQQMDELQSIDIDRDTISYCLADIIVKIVDYFFRNKFLFSVTQLFEAIFVKNDGKKKLPNEFTNTRQYWIALLESALDCKQFDLLEKILKDNPPISEISTDVQFCEKRFSVFKRIVEASICAKNMNIAVVFFNLILKTEGENSDKVLALTTLFCDVLFKTCLYSINSFLYEKLIDCAYNGFNRLPLGKPTAFRVLITTSVRLLQRYYQHQHQHHSQTATTLTTDKYESIKYKLLCILQRAQGGIYPEIDQRNHILHIPTDCSVEELHLLLLYYLSLLQERLPVTFKDNLSIIPYIVNDRDQQYMRMYNVTNSSSEILKRMEFVLSGAYFLAGKPIPFSPTKSGNGGGGVDEDKYFVVDHSNLYEHLNVNYVISLD